MTGVCYLATDIMTKGRQEKVRWAADQDVLLLEFLTLCAVKGLVITLRGLLSHRFTLSLHKGLSSDRLDRSTTMDSLNTHDTSAAPADELAVPAEAASAPDEAPASVAEAVAVPPCVFAIVACDVAYSATCDNLH